MAKRTDSEQLDEAVDLAMSHPDAPLSQRLAPRLAALLRIAGDLRGLPRPEFKARLRAELLAEADPVAALYGKPLGTDVADITARLDELAQRRQLAAYDLETALRGLPAMTMRFLASLNVCTVGVSRFGNGASHWECHSAGDELLHILEGETDVVTLTARGPVRTTVGAGSLFVCPQGFWHRLEPRSPGTLLFATPGEGTEGSADPPRRLPQADASAPALAACDLRAAVRDLVELKITPETTAAEADAAVRPLTKLGQCTLGVVRYSGLHPWERHPDGDELLHVLDGAVDLTILGDEGPVHATLPAGSIFVCPRGLWHRPLPRPAATLLFATPGATTEASFAEDPRRDA